MNPRCTSSDYVPPTEEEVLHNLVRNHSREAARFEREAKNYRAMAETARQKLIALSIKAARAALKGTNQ